MLLPGLPPRTYGISPHCQNPSQDYLLHVYGNPHCMSPPSEATHSAVDAVRQQLLEFFGAAAGEYEVGCAGGDRMQCYPQAGCACALYS